MSEEAAVKAVRLGRSGLTFVCVVPPDWPAVRAARVVATTGDRAVLAEVTADAPAPARGPRLSPRPDGFLLHVPLAAFPAPLRFACRAEVDLADGRTKPLAPSAAAADILRLDVRDARDLLHAVQLPSHRVKDKAALPRLASWGLDLFPDNYEARAGAILAIGYRRVEGTALDEDVAARLDRALPAILEERPDLRPGPFLRWHVSLRLLAGYLAWQAGAAEAAAEQFTRVADLAPELHHWPSALTNILNGLFLAGWIAHGRGDRDGAARPWSRAEGVLRYGAAMATLTNAYAYDELRAAVAVAGECFVGLAEARAGGPVEDARVMAPGRRLDIARLPALARNLGIRSP